MTTDFSDIRLLASSTVIAGERTGWTIKGSADATLDAKVDAAHELLVAMTLAYRSAPPEIAAA